MLSNLYIYQNEAQINMDLKCAICLDPFQSPLRDAHCGHTFCFQCLKTWLRQQLSCPICRQYFTKFVSIADQSLLKELDYLLVQCKNCNETNIERGNFINHITHVCSKRMVIDQESNEGNLEERLNFECLYRRMNQSAEIRRRQQQQQQQNYEQSNFNSLPMWVILISGAHLLIHLSIMVPIAVVLIISDIIFRSFFHGIIRLIRSIKLRI